MTTHRTPTPTPVAALLPHRGAMRLIDTLLDCGANHIRVALTVRDVPPFGDGEGGVPAWIGLEYMAQAICVFSGLELSAVGLPPKIGLLLGTRGYRATVPRFTAGSVLEVAMRRVLGEDGEIWVLDGTIRCAGSTLAEARVKTYRPEDIRRFLELPRDAG